MTASLAAELVATAMLGLLLLITALIDADDTTTTPVYIPAATTTHPCWAEYDPATLRAAAEQVAAEMAEVRRQLAAIEVVHIGQRELVPA